MKDLAQIEVFRDRSPDVLAIFGEGDDHTAVFNVPTPGHFYMLKVLVSTHSGWDHLSASLPDRCPTWAEMDRLFQMFFLPDETAIQLHVPDSEHIDHHRFVLHLWRPQAVAVPKPPFGLVGAPLGWRPGRGRGR